MLLIFDDCFDDHIAISSSRHAIQQRSNQGSRSYANRWLFVELDSFYTEDVVLRYAYASRNLDRPE